MLHRRKLLQILPATAAAYFLPFESKAKGKSCSSPEFAYCFNMATIRGHNLGFTRELETASKAGFRSVEIWMDSLQHFLAEGGTLKDAKLRLESLGLTVENAIGFAEWIPDDEVRRKKGIEQMKREMDMLATIGCKRIAAPPTGATDASGLDLQTVAKRYRRILELGDQTGVVPQLEMWGFSKNLSRVSEVLFVAMESGHASARVLLDIFHLYKGGYNIDTLPLIGKGAVEVLHVNDYSAKYTPAVITDADRIHPGDGIAPIKRILSILKNPDRPLIISEEVFNAAYYKQDALQVAKTALQKMKAITNEA